MIRVEHGDCLDVMPQLAQEGVQVQAVITDPPYGLGFMGKAWDAPENIAFRPDTWRLVLDMLPPGGHLLAFGGTRTYHRLVVAIEDAGFEVRDQLAWIFGGGWPKGQSIGNATNAPHWDGWSTTLKPAFEPIVLARKPISEKNIAQNVLQHGVGAINIDGCRVPVAPNDRHEYGVSGDEGSPGKNAVCYGIRPNRVPYQQHHKGRWPANVCHDGSDEVLSGFPLSGDLSAARFFYCAKATAEERAGSRHPTVKPQALLRWLARLITPPGGTILDPFAGSGSLAPAAVAEGFGVILIEREAEYVADIKRRLESPIQAGMPL